VNTSKNQHTVASVSDIPLRTRVAQIRYDVNWQGTAVRMQYERLVAHLDLPLGEGSIAHLRGVVDLDFLVISVYRLLHVAERAKTFSCDIDGKLKLAIKVFRSRWDEELKDVRNALEHLDHGGAHIIPFRSGSTISFLWRGGKIDVHEIFTDADKLCAAICRAIEPLETQ
jgi:hypothetical protein